MALLILGLWTLAMALLVLALALTSRFATMQSSHEDTEKECVSGASVGREFSDTG